MIKNPILFIIDANGDILHSSGTIRAINGYREYVMVVTPQPLTESLSMSMMTNNANYIQHEQYVIPTAYKGVNVLSTDHALYQTCADWNVFAVEIKPTALADISAFRSGSVTFAFQFRSITPSSKCITYIGVFGIDNELPVTATVGDYYDCEDINYTLVSGDHTYVFTTGMYVYWNGTRWVKDRLVTTLNTPTTSIGVEPSHAVGYELDDDEINYLESIGGQVAVNTVGIANLVNDLDDLVNEDARLESAKVDRTQTIIGIDLADNITLDEFRIALGNATTSISGLMSPTDKGYLNELYALLDTDDADALVNTLGEILALFENYPEGVDLVTALAGKVDKVLTAYDTLTGESVVGTEFVYVDAGGTAKKMTLAELFEASNSSPSAFIPNGVYEDLTAGYAINAQNKLVAGNNITIDPITNVISASGSGGGGGNSNEPDGVTIVLNENDELEVSTAVLNDIALKVNTSDIVNNLTSTDTNKPLSANQGKVLKDLVDTKSNDNAVVKLSGTQSITGTKNFTGTLQFGGKTVATLDDITTVFKYKGSVASYANLPSTGQVIGDVWNVLDTGKNFAWDGTAWDDLSGIVDLSNYYTKSETNSLFDDKQNKLIAGENITIDENNVISVSGGEEIFFATFGTTTFAEITQALADGKLPIAISGTFYYTFVNTPAGTPVSYYFQNVWLGTLKHVYVNDLDVWGVRDLSLELQSNKVQTISASSTTTQFPSATAVWDLVDATVGDIESALSGKVDKVTGKGLSTEDYTSDEKTKLTGIQAGAEVNVQSDWNASSGDALILNKPAIPTKISDLTNDAGYITGYTETDPIFTAWNKSTGISITKSQVSDLIEATQSLSGLMSATDKQRLDVLHALLEEDTSNSVVDSINEVLAIFNNYPEGADLVTALAGKVDKVTGKGLSTNDLTNTLKSNYDTAYTHSLTAHAPSNAEANVNADWNASSGDAQILNKPTLSTVATSGSYADLSNKPTIPDTSGLLPKSGGTLENYNEKLTTLSTSSGAINLSSSSVFVQTPSANITYSISNAVSGVAHSFTLIVNMGATVRTLTFPASVKWQGGEIPDMTTPSKTYVLTFLTVDGGTTWLGMFGGEF